MSNKLLHLLALFLMVLLTSCGTDFENQFCPGVDSCSSDDGSSGGSTITYTTLFSDDFNRADGAVGANYNLVIDGGSRLDILTNEVRLGRNFITGLTPVGYYVTNLSQTNTRVTADFRVGGGGVGAGSGFIGLVARSQNTTTDTDSYMCRINTVDGKMSIWRFSTGGAGNSELISPSTSAGFNANDVYQMVFTVEGSSLSCSLTGSATINASTTDTTFTSGYHGFTGGIENAIEIYADNFLIETGS